MILIQKEYSQVCNYIATKNWFQTSLSNRQTQKQRCHSSRQFRPSTGNYPTPDIQFRTYFENHVLNLSPIRHTAKVPRRLSFSSQSEANRAVWIGFFSLIAVTVLMNITLLFEPLQGDDFAKTTHEATNTIFSLMPRLAFASLTAYLLSQHHDVWAFHFWKNKYPTNRQLWIRNNLSTMVSQAIDSAVFVLIAFYGVFETNVLFEVFLTTYVLKFIVAAADTPFVYWGKRIHRKKSFWIRDT